MSPIETLRKKLKDLASQGSNTLPFQQKLPSPVQKLVQQPINQAKFIMNVGKKVIAPPVELGKQYGTLINNQIDINRAKKQQQFIQGEQNKMFNTMNKVQDPAMRQRLNTRINTMQGTQDNTIQGLKERIKKNPTVGSMALNTVKTALLPAGLTTLGTTQGLTGMASSGILGAGINKVMGGDPRQGLEDGVAMYPQISGITRFSNPLIERTVSKFAPNIAGKIPTFVKEGIARIPGNVAEGAVIDATLGRRPLGLASAVIDAATSFIPGGPNIRNRKQQLDNVDVVKPWQKAFNAAKDNKVADKLIMTIRGYETIKKAGGTTKQFESVFREASEFFLPEKARNLPLDEQVNVWKYILNRHAGSSIDVDVPQILKDVDMMYRPQSLGLGIVEDGKLKNNPQPNVANSLLSDIKSKKFVPSTKWQEVPEGTVVPPGGTYKMNMATGKTEAKWDNPPPTSPPKVKVKDSKYAFNINKNRLNMNKGQTKAFEKQVKQALPELEKVKGKKLTFDEVTEEAQKADLLKKAIGRETTANFEAQLTKTRQRMVELNKQIDNYRKTGNTQGAERLTMELIQHIKSVSGAAADAGRRLGSFRITAEARPFREQLLDEIIKNQKYSDEQADNLVRAAARVDFNDPAQVTRFFKEVVKPTVGQMLEEYRYINLLSSPRTHLTNIFSNAIQTGVLNPATKLTTGIVDPIASVLTGKARENYIGEVPMYYRGMLGSFPDAFTALSEVFQGKRALTNLDFKTLQRMPSKANIITKSLEGFDVFFRTLIEGGEKQALDYKFGKMGIEAGEDVINNIAEQRGQYYTFRQGFDNPGQGAVLDWFDKGTQAVMQLRRVPGVSWFVPFIQTPMNIVKQGFEYSPAGFTTMIKADNKTEQFSKALLGSAVFAGAGYLALNDRLTYAAPRDPEQKKLFYASGKQPYSVKVGDKWVSFSKIGPLAYPLALAGAIKYSFEDNPSAVTDDTFEKTTKALTGAVGFFADQSYMQGIGNMIKALEGQEGFNFSKIAGNVATQYVPLASLQRWVNNIIDPIYRKPKTFVENIKSSVIGQTGDMGYYEDPLGEPSKRQSPILNSVLPFSVTTENEKWNPLLDARQKELQGNAILNEQEKDLQEKVGLNPASADSGDNKMDAYSRKLQEKTVINRVEMEGKADRVGNKIIYQTDSGHGTIDLGKVKDLKGGNKYLDAIKQSEAFSLSDDILDADLTDQVKNKALSEIGVTRDDAEYYKVAKDENDLKTIYALDQLENAKHEDVLSKLTEWRKPVNGKYIASDGVIDNLVDDGIITKEEGKALKNIDFDTAGKLKIKSSGGGRKLKIGSTQALKSINIGTPSKMGQVSFAKRQSKLQLKARPTRQKIKLKKLNLKKIPASKLKIKSLNSANV